MDAVNSRRTVLVAAAGAAALAGCSNSGDGGGSTPPPAATGSAAAGRQNPPATPVAQSSPPAQGGKVLAQTSDIPVGGGTVFADQKVVVTQPEAGTFKGFSAICTHQGCTVSSVSGGTINCPCHGSKFRIADASVANGPATRPLPGQQITVENGSILMP
ncbi:Rieske (2Fe-2S) protein [Streptomyces mauvecolor]|uniref:Cytochrome bc1 complex Rieske iron-sulfur subunit n=1 Tax=Streptomyces mauvecolor TaxID=58345 RepID=A0ABV9ULK5_9ACTN